MNHPSIDHSLLSPNGRMSKRARDAAMKREAARLFAGVDLRPKTPQPTEAQKLRWHARELRALADRGMSTRRFNRIAAEKEAQADVLEEKDGAPC